MTRSLLALFAGLTLPTVGPTGPDDDIPTDPERWIATEPPEPWSERWFAANHNSDSEWVVSLRDGRPRVDPRHPEEVAADPPPFEIEPGSAREGLAGDRLQVEVPDGWIVAFNAGEFGAGLWWFSSDGRERSRIAEAWIQGFFQTEAGLLALEGLAHGAALHGQLLRLSRDPSGRWRAEPWVDLGNAPQAATADVDGTLIVATTERLLRVDPAGRTAEVMFDHAFWGGLYPNSIVATPAGTIYLGMRHGVARIEPKGEDVQIHWLLPNREFVDMKPVDGFK